MSADYPTGKWYRLYIEKYEDRVMKEFQKQIMKGTTQNLEEEVNRLSEQLLEAHEQYTDVASRLEEILNSLKSSIEKGDQLYIGIVLGQSIKNIEQILYS
jgi:hypothetical protein